MDLGHAQHALDGPAALAGVREGRPRRAAHRARDVGVGEHEHRVLAVEREHRACEAARARLADLAPGAGRAREADLGHRGGHERGPRVRVAVDDRQQTLGQTGAGEDARDPLAAQRHVGRGLEHHAVAGHERHRHVAQRRGERLGGRTEDADDPQRLVAPAPALDRMLGAREGDLLAGQDAGAVLGQPLERLDRREQLHDLRLGARPALLGDDEVGQLVELVDDRLGGAGHVAGAVAEAQGRPQRLHAGGLLDGCRHRARARHRDGPQALAGGRAEGLQLCSGCARLHGEARLDDRFRGTNHLRPRARRISCRRSRSAASASSGE